MIIPLTELVFLQINCLTSFITIFIIYVFSYLCIYEFRYFLFFFLVLFNVIVVDLILDHILHLYVLLCFYIFVYLMFLNRLYREEMQTRRPLVTLFVSFLLLFSLLRTIILLFDLSNKSDYYYHPTRFLVVLHLIFFPHAYMLRAVFSLVAFCQVAMKPNSQKNDVRCEYTRGAKSFCCCRFRLISKPTNCDYFVLVVRKIPQYSPLL